MKTFKSSTLIVLPVVLFAFLLKPSYGRFKEFGEDLNGKPYKLVLKKVNDYLIYAVFEKTLYKWDYGDVEYKIVSEEKYAGYLLNFYKLK